ncbi:MAG: MFS transporter [Actinomycetota bacterium]|nr:MFS transporter [Actinomycetota bacterium]
MPQPVEVHERRWTRSTIALLTASLCSSTASLALVTAIGKHVYDITASELDLGLLGLAEFAPAALLVLVTGAVADRWDRRRIAAVAAVGEAGAVVLLLWYLSTDPSAVTPVFGLVVAFGVARAFSAPALRSLPADIVAPERLPWLTARWAGSFQIAAVLGPVLGGTMYAVDELAPYVVVVALFLAAAIAVSLVPRPMFDTGADVVPTRRGLAQAFDGFRFVRGHPILLGAISLDLFAVLFGGALALLPAIAEERLGVGAVGYGWLRAATGIGAGLVTLVLAVRPVERHVGRKLLIAVLGFGLATILLATTTSYAVAFVALLLAAGSDAVSMFIRVTLVPLVTPPAMRGRVLALENVFIGASNELGAFESGVTGQLLGPALAIGVGGVATVVVAGAWAVLFPALRDVDRFPSRPDRTEPPEPPDRSERSDAHPTSGPGATGRDLAGDAAT